MLTGRCGPHAAAVKPCAASFHPPPYSIPLTNTTNAAIQDATAPAPLFVPLSGGPVCRLPDKRPIPGPFRKIEHVTAGSFLPE